jgi:pimeloyl-ACP methyl ester carboxylesterase
LGAFFFIYLGACYFLSGLVLNPVSSSAQSRQRIAAIWPQKFSSYINHYEQLDTLWVPGASGEKMHGQFIDRSSNCLIILAHGWTSTWEGMVKYLPILDSCGCNYYLYDHRGHGLSPEQKPTGGYDEAKDLVAVTRWFIQEKGFEASNIAWVGASWGAATVLQAGADDLNVGFIMADAPFKDWYSAVFERGKRDYGSWISMMGPGLMQILSWRTGIPARQASPYLAASKIDEPVLLLHSAMDVETESWQSEDIASQLNDQSEFHHLYWGGGHTEDILVRPELMQNLLEEFWKSKVPQFAARLN